MGPQKGHVYKSCQADKLQAKWSLHNKLLSYLKTNKY